MKYISEQKLHGWVCLHKPEGITSAQLLGRLKRHLPRKTKVGHAGTLDNLACGVLPVALGNATKTVPLIMGAEKTYTFKVAWGAQTDTDDRDGQIIATSTKLPTIEEIQKITSVFVGEIQQIPPKFSALKVNGKRASDRIRNDEEVELSARAVMIYSFELLECLEAEAKFQVRCGKGTYVRALARDMAKLLGTVGHVSFLRRDRVGSFSLIESILLEKKDEIDENAKAKLTSAIIPIRTVLDDIPAVSCTDVELGKLAKGQKIPVTIDQVDTVFAVDDLDVVAIGGVKEGFFYPRNVFINGAN